MNENWKTVSCTAGSPHNPMRATVKLNGVLPDEPLRPRMARRAARIAFGHDNQVTVWDADFDIGYRLYAESARKLRSEPS